MMKWFDDKKRANLSMIILPPYGVWIRKVGWEYMIKKGVRWENVNIRAACVFGINERICDKKRDGNDFNNRMVRKE